MMEEILEYSKRETEGIVLKSLKEVQAQLEDGLHIESEFNKENKLGISKIDGEKLDRCKLGELEDKASYVIDYLRQFEGVLDVDYELGGEYPLGLVIIFK